jgi:hypothetical protein
MKKNLVLFIAFYAILFTSCRDDFKFEPNTGNLTFSRDTIYLDTVFTNTASSTYKLKVYNKSNKDIKIPNIRLGKGENSDYRLMVDGVPGKKFTNIEILAKDSMYIFIETTINYDQYQNSTSEYLYTDLIEFDYGANYQKVELVTLVKDAYFLYPKRYSDTSYEHVLIGDNAIYGFVLDENDVVNGNELIWKNDKPYVIYGYAVVPTSKNLEIQEGAHIHFHYNSGLIVAQDAHLESNGSIQKPIIIEGDRLEANFDNRSGQWGALWITSGSTAAINNTIIKNGTVGLLIEDNANTVNLYNVQLYNHTHYGIYGIHANIKGENIVTNNLGVAGLGITLGGTYEFNHCTFANLGALGSTTCLVMDNGDGSIANALSQANFYNSIFYGNTSFALNFKREGNTTFNFYFANNLIRFSDFGQSDPNNLYPINNNTNYINNIIAKNLTVVPDFKNIKNNNLIIGDKSAALGISQSIPNSGFDILGNPRPINQADAGAYNHQSFE